MEIFDLWFDVELIQQYDVRMSERLETDWPTDNLDLHEPTQFAILRKGNATSKSQRSRLRGVTSWDYVDYGRGLKTINPERQSPA